MSTNAGKYASIAKGANTVMHATAIIKCKLISNPLLLKLNS